MACGGCSRRRAEANSSRSDVKDVDVMNGYSNLTDRQIKARLEVYKRKYCGVCDKRYDCDYTMYTECRKNTKK